MNTLDLTNKALLREWKKIEKANIFDNLEDFARFYYQNGEKECFRRYTTDPWSKKNFFFGSYDDLLNFYKNDLGIPNSVKEKIGLTYNYLTILDFIVERVNEKKTIFAKCQCVCGNIVIKRWEAVRDGNIKSCGCKNKRKLNNMKISDTKALLYWDYKMNIDNPNNISVNSSKKFWWKCNKCGKSYQKTAKAFTGHLSDSCPNCSRPKIANVKEIYPELIDEEWDFKRNSILPENCPIDSKLKIWWSPKYGKPFQATIAERTRSANSTSYEEQTIYFYIKDVFQDAENRKQIATDKGVIEIDIYIPCLSLAIEYDGKFWHEYKNEKDLWKNCILKENNIYLIRVREAGLTGLTTNYGDIIYHKIRRNDEGLYLYEVVTKIFLLINLYIKNTGLYFSKEILEKISSFHLSKDQLIADRQKIYCLYKTAYQKDNITKTCLIKYWNFQKNGDLLPSNIKYNDRAYVWFKCPKGFEFQTSPSYLRVVQNCFNQKRSCVDCYANICPFYEFQDFGCPDNVSCQFSNLAQDCKNATYHTTKWLEDKRWKEAVAEIENNNHKISFEELNSILRFQLDKKRCGKLIYLLYISGKLLEYDKKGRFSFCASIDFILDKNLILDIFEICGVDNFEFFLADFDEPMIRERFFNILKHQFDNDNYYNISGYKLERLITQQIHIFSKPFLFLLLNYLKFIGPRFKTGWYFVIDLPECRKLITDKLIYLGVPLNDIINI